EIVAAARRDRDGMDRLELLATPLRWSGVRVIGFNRGWPDKGAGWHRHALSRRACRVSGRSRTRGPRYNRPRSNGSSANRPRDGSPRDEGHARRGDERERPDEPEPPLGGVPGALGDQRPETLARRLVERPGEPRLAVDCAASAARRVSPSPPRPAGQRP